MKDNINFKHSQIYKQILDGNLTHSIMLISPDNELLDCYADDIVETNFCLNDNKPCGICSNCLKIKHGNMVDVLTFPREGETLKAGELTDLLDSVYELPFENEKKFYIINNFSNTDALIQNKLLKTLEEPPEHAYFILKVQNETQILQTIKSRCQKIFLPKLKEEALAEFVESGVDKNLLDEAIAFCDGSIALAKEYIKNPNFLNNVDFVFDLLKKKRVKRVLLLATGALFSPLFVYQKENINSICHAISLEAI